MKDNKEELNELLFDGCIHRINYIPQALSTPIIFRCYKNKEANKWRDFIIDREFFGLDGERTRDKSINMLINFFYKYQDE